VALVVLVLSTTTATTVVASDSEAAAAAAAAAATATGEGTSTSTYHLLSSQDIATKLHHWEERYPNLVRVTTAQAKYFLPTAGTSSDCPFEKRTTNHSNSTTSAGAGCLNYFLTIQDYTTHPSGSQSSSQLPEVLWNGCMHGDERLGPTIVMEAAQLLLDAAWCESKPNFEAVVAAAAAVEASTTTITTTLDTLWARELQLARTCRTQLEQLGIDDAHRQWLARLVSTRRLVVVPSANALGFYQKKRLEEEYNPQVDFPFEATSSTTCMQTIAGRTLNEIVREHMFQMSISFHGGRRGIGYSWSNANENEYEEDGSPRGPAPDEAVMKAVATAMSQVASGGGRTTTPPYEVGTIQDVFDEEAGGTLEDFSYATSWHNHPPPAGRMNSSLSSSEQQQRQTKLCSPTTYGGYDKAKTIYNDAVLRSVHLLVGATDDRTPPTAETLGESLDLFSNNKNNMNNETALHVARNIRLSLLSLDLVQPYVSIFGVHGVKLSDDLVPLRPNTGAREYCQTRKAVALPRGNQNQVILEWTVGGGMDIAETELWYTKWEHTKPGLDCLLQQPEEEKEENSATTTTLLLQGFVKAEPLGATSGSGYFAPQGPQPQPPQDDISTATIHLKDDNKATVLGPIFRAQLDLNQFVTGDRIVVIARARVDQDWKWKMNNNTAFLPQSHLANARNNPNWRYENAGKVVHGRVHWYSTPITLVVDEFATHVGPIELYDRFQPMVQPSDLIDTASDGQGFIKSEHWNETRSFTLLWTSLLLVSGLATLSLLAIVMFRRRTLQFQLKLEQIMVHATEGVQDDEVTFADSNRSSSNSNNNGKNSIHNNAVHSGSPPRDKYMWHDDSDNKIEETQWHASLIRASGGGGGGGGETKLGEDDDEDVEYIDLTPIT
jgi:hypothetical protein